MSLVQHQMQNSALWYPIVFSRQNLLSLQRYVYENLPFEVRQILCSHVLIQNHRSSEVNTVWRIEREKPLHLRWFSPSSTPLIPEEAFPYVIWSVQLISLCGHFIYIIWLFLFRIRCSTFFVFLSLIKAIPSISAHNIPETWFADDMTLPYQ